MHRSRNLPVLLALVALSPLAAGAASEAPSAPASAAALVFKPEAATELPGASQWLMALLLCAVLLAGLLWLLRRHGTAAPLLRAPAGAARQLQLLERLPLAPGTQLLAVRDGERRLLILLGPTGAQCLPEAAPVPPSTPEAGDAA